MEKRLNQLTTSCLRREEVGTLIKISEEISKKGEIPWITLVKKLIKKLLKSRSQILLDNICKIIRSQIHQSIKGDRRLQRKEAEKLLEAYTSLITYINHSLEESDASVQEISRLTSAILPATIDVKVLSVRKEKSDVAQTIYEKMTSLLGQSSETIADVLLHCRTLIFTKLRDPVIFVPIIRLFFTSLKRDKYYLQSISPELYLKYLVIGKFWLFMSSKEEISSVRTFIISLLKMPPSFAEWSLQANIPWLKLETFNTKSILKVIVISTALQTIYSKRHGSGEKKIAINAENLKGKGQASSSSKKESGSHGVGANGFNEDQLSNIKEVQKSVKDGIQSRKLESKKEKRRAHDGNDVACVLPKKKKQKVHIAQKELVGEIEAEECHENTSVTGDTDKEGKLGGALGDDRTEGKVKLKKKKVKQDLQTEMNDDIIERVENDINDTLESQDRLKCSLERSALESGLNCDISMDSHERKEQLGKEVKEEKMALKKKKKLKKKDTLDEGRNVGCEDDGVVAPLAESHCSVSMDSLVSPKAAKVKKKKKTKVKEPLDVESIVESKNENYMLMLGNNISVVVDTAESVEEMVKLKKKKKAKMKDSLVGENKADSKNVSDTLLIEDNSCVVTDVVESVKEKIKLKKKTKAKVKESLDDENEVESKTENDKLILGNSTLVVVDTVGSVKEEKIKLKRKKKKKTKVKESMDSESNVESKNDNDFKLLESNDIVVRDTVESIKEKMKLRKKKKSKVKECLDEDHEVESKIENDVLLIENNASLCVDTLECERKSEDSPGCLEENQLREGREEIGEKKVKLKKQKKKNKIKGRVDAEKGNESKLSYNEDLNDTEANAMKVVDIVLDKPESLVQLKLEENLEIYRKAGNLSETAKEIIKDAPKVKKGKKKRDQDKANKDSEMDIEEKTVSVELSSEAPVENKDPKSLKKRKKKLAKLEEQICLEVDGGEYGFEREFHNDNAQKESNNCSDSKLEDSHKDLEIVCTESKEALPAKKKKKTDVLSENFGDKSIDAADAHCVLSKVVVSAKQSESSSEVKSQKKKRRKSKMSININDSHSSDFDGKECVKKSKLPRIKNVVDESDGNGHNLVDRLSDSNDQVNDLSLSLQEGKDIVPKETENIVTEAKEAFESSNKHQKKRRISEVMKCSEMDSTADRESFPLHDEGIRYNRNSTPCAKKSKTEDSLLELAEGKDIDKKINFASKLFKLLFSKTEKEIQFKDSFLSLCESESVVSHSREQSDKKCTEEKHSKTKQRNVKGQGKVSSSRKDKSNERMSRGDRGWSLSPPECHSKRGRLRTSSWDFTVTSLSTDKLRKASLALKSLPTKSSDKPKVDNTLVPSCQESLPSEVNTSCVRSADQDSDLDIICHKTEVAANEKEFGIIGVQSGKKEGIKAVLKTNIDDKEKCSSIDGHSSDEPNTKVDNSQVSSCQGLPSIVEENSLPFVTEDVQSDEEKGMKAILKTIVRDTGKSSSIDGLREKYGVSPLESNDNSSSSSDVVILLEENDEEKFQRPMKDDESEGKSLDNQVSANNDCLQGTRNEIEENQILIEERCSEDICTLKSIASSSAVEDRLTESGTDKSDSTQLNLSQQVLSCSNNRSESQRELLIRESDDGQILEQEKNSLANNDVGNCSYLNYFSGALENGGKMLEDDEALDSNATPNKRNQRSLADQEKQKVNSIDVGKVVSMSCESNGVIRSEEDGISSGLLESNNNATNDVENLPSDGKIKNLETDMEEDLGDSPNNNELKDLSTDAENNLQGLPNVTVVKASDTVRDRNVLSSAETNGLKDVAVDVDKKVQNSPKKIEFTASLDEEKNLLDLPSNSKLKELETDIRNALESSYCSPDKTNRNSLDSLNSIQVLESCTGEESNLKDSPKINELKEVGTDVMEKNVCSSLKNIKENELDTDDETNSYNGPSNIEVQEPDGAAKKNFQDLPKELQVNDQAIDAKRNFQDSLEKSVLKELDMNTGLNVEHSPNHIELREQEHNVRENSENATENCQLKVVDSVNANSVQDLPKSKLCIKQKDAHDIDSNQKELDFDLGSSHTDLKDCFENNDGGTSPDTEKDCEVSKEADEECCTKNESLPHDANSNVSEASLGLHGMGKKPETTPTINGDLDKLSESYECVSCNDGDEAYEASSDASEEPTPVSRRKTRSQRKFSPLLSCPDEASDSDFSPLRRSQRSLANKEKQKLINVDAKVNLSKTNFSKVGNEGSHNNSGNAGQDSKGVLTSDTESDKKFSLSEKQVFRKTGRKRGRKSYSSSKEYEISPEQVRTRKMRKQCFSESEISCSIVEKDFLDNLKSSRKNKHSVSKESDSIKESIEREKINVNASSPLKKNSDPNEMLTSSVMEFSKNGATNVSSNVKSCLIECQVTGNDKQKGSEGAENFDDDEQVCLDENKADRTFSPRELLEEEEGDEIEVLSTSGICDSEDSFESNVPIIGESPNKKALSKSVPMTRKLRKSSKQSPLGKKPEHLNITDNDLNKLEIPQLRAQRVSEAVLAKEVLISPDVSDEECELILPVLSDAELRRCGSSSEGYDQLAKLPGSSNIEIRPRIQRGGIRSPQKVIPEEQDESSVSRKKPSPTKRISSESHSKEVRKSSDRDTNNIRRSSRNASRRNYRKQSTGTSDENTPEKINIVNESSGKCIGSETHSTENELPKIKAKCPSSCNSSSTPVDTDIVDEAVSNLSAESESLSDRSDKGSSASSSTDSVFSPRVLRSRRGSSSISALAKSPLKRQEGRGQKKELSKSNNTVIDDVEKHSSPRLFDLGKSQSDAENDICHPEKESSASDSRKSDLVINSAFKDDNQMSSKKSADKIDNVSSSPVKMGNKKSLLDVNSIAENELVEIVETKKLNLLENELDLNATAEKEKPELEATVTKSKQPSPIKSKQPSPVKRRTRMSVAKHGIVSVEEKTEQIFQGVPKVRTSQTKASTHSPSKQSSSSPKDSQLKLATPPKMANSSTLTVSSPSPTKIVKELNFFPTPSKLPQKESDSPDQPVSRRTRRGSQLLPSEAKKGTR